MHPEGVRVLTWGAVLKSAAQRQFTDTSSVLALFPLWWPPPAPGRLAHALSAAGSPSHISKPPAGRLMASSVVSRVGRIAVSLRGPGRVRAVQIVEGLRPARAQTSGYGGLKKPRRYREVDGAESLHDDQIVAEKWPRFDRMGQIPGFFSKSLDVFENPKIRQVYNGAA